MILPDMPRTRITKEDAEPERYNITALEAVIHRKPNTIRKWEREGILPKRLHPKRDDQNRRYWTPAQVKGIVAWMRKNDMRPGNTITDPSKEHEHIEHLRRPKYLTGHHIRSAREMSANGKSLDQIIRRIFPRTKYATPEALEGALKKVAAEQGWELPRRPRPKTKPPKRRRKKNN